MDKDTIKELILEQIVNNLEIGLEEETDSYIGKSYIKVKLYYMGETISETEDIEIPYR